MPGTQIPDTVDGSNAGHQATEIQTPQSSFYRAHRRTTPDPKQNKP